MMKSTVPLAAAALALISAGALHAQTVGTTGTGIPAQVQSAPVIAAPAPVAEPKAAEPVTEPKVGKKMLAKYDKNGDGKLDAEERAAMERDEPNRKAEKLKKYDKNGDGKLDEQEKVQMRVDRLREEDAAKKAKTAPDKAQ